MKLYLHRTLELQHAFQQAAANVNLYNLFLIAEAWLLIAEYSLERISVRRNNASYIFFSLAHKN